MLYLPVSCRFSKSSMVKILQLFTLFYRILRIRIAYYFISLSKMVKRCRKEKKEELCTQSQKLTKEKYFLENRGGVKVEPGSKMIVVSGKYHEPEEPYDVSARVPWVTLFSSSTSSSNIVSLSV